MRCALCTCIIDNLICQRDSTEVTTFLLYTRATYAELPFNTSTMVLVSHSLLIQIQKFDNYIIDVTIDKNNENPRKFLWKIRQIVFFEKSAKLRW